MKPDAVKKIWVILDTLRATVWTGGHLFRAVTLLPQAWKNRDRERIDRCE